MVYILFGFSIETFKYGWGIPTFKMAEENKDIIELIEKDFNADINEIIKEYED